MKPGPTNKEETKERILITLREHKVISRSALALLSRTAYYTLPTILTDLQKEGKVEVFTSPAATYIKLKEDVQNG